MFLASSDSQWVAGEVIAVSGGLREATRQQAERCLTLGGACVLQGIFPAHHHAVLSGRQCLFKKLEANVERYSRTPASRNRRARFDRGSGYALRSGAARRAENSTRICISIQSLDRGYWTGISPRALKLTEYVADLGFDVALIRTPHFYRPQMQPANLLAFYRAVADRSPIPVLIYNVPPFTAYNIPAEVVVELAGHPNIIGIKESSGDVDRIRLIVERTRHIKRSVTVTETFEAVTPRMLKATEKNNEQGGELALSVASLTGSRPRRRPLPWLPESRLAKRKSAFKSSPARRPSSNRRSRLVQPAPFWLFPRQRPPRAMKSMPHGKKATTHWPVSNRIALRAPRSVSQERWVSQA